MSDSSTSTMNADVEKHAEPAPHRKLSEIGEPTFEQLSPILSRKSLKEQLEDGDIDQETLQRIRTGSLRDPSLKEDANAPRGSPQNPFFVTLNGREKINPHTWSRKYRWTLTWLCGSLLLNATFSSTGPSMILGEIMVHYKVSQEVAILTIALFVLGYCVGPLFWGPYSERAGRKPALLYGFIPYVGFQVGVALAPNIGALLVFRFLAGCFAASPVTITGAVLADLWEPAVRGDAMSIFSLMPFAGPGVAPVIAGFMAVRGVYFRWVLWVLVMFSGACAVLLIVFLPETSVEANLDKEAKRLRKETGDDRYHSSLQLAREKESGWKDTLSKTIGKPVIMLFQEPMLFILTLYMSFVYGLVYLLFEAIPIIYEEYHGLNAGETGLVFLALPLGGIVAVTIYVKIFNTRYVRVMEAMAPKAVPPEERLIPLLFVVPIFAFCFFWLGWCYYPSLSIWASIPAIFILGAQILLIFLSIFNYIIDTYYINAASALSINTVMRSAFGAGFPLFAVQMYRKLSVPGASSLLGGIAIVFIPVPFIFYKYGKKIRSMSKNAVVRDN